MESYRNDPFHAYYKFIIENMKDVIWEMTPEYIFTFVSPNVKNMTGHSPEELVGSSMLDLLVEDSRKYVSNLIFQNRYKRINGDPEIFLMAMELICKAGKEKWVEVSATPIFKEGRLTGYIGATRDISEKREYEGQLNKYINDLETMNKKLETMANIDTLTGAYNRRKFDDDLNLIIKKKVKNSPSFSLIFFDIDNFKIINDRFGHKIGDCILQRISKLVIENVRITDRLFRWGGEEFILILPEANLETAEKVAEKIRDIIQYHDFGIGQKITVSLGVGEYKDENSDQIIKRLDEALLQAKAKGKNTIVAC